MIIGIVILLIGLAVLFAQSNRYYLLGIGDCRAYKIDRWTGKTWLIHSYGGEAYAKAVKVSKADS